MIFCSLYIVLLMINWPNVNCAMEGLMGQLRCATNKENVEVHLFGYGCFCGLGNKGKTPYPVDSVDQCCKTHDECYNNVKRDRMCNAEDRIFYKIEYKWHCEKYRPICDDQIADTCPRRLCRCDKDFAECLSEQTLNKEHENYPENLCE